MDEFIREIAPYNLWNDNNLPIGFPRLGYTDVIAGFCGNRLIKVLTGQRRVGKSYIMRQVAMKLVEQGVARHNILFINRELAVFDFISDYKALISLVAAYRRLLKPTGRIYIFIDEVQEIENWERGVNSLSQDYTIEAEIFISGSNSRLLSGELASLLSGRYVEMTVYPFSYNEYCGIHNIPPGRDSFVNYLNDGGLPELAHLPIKDTKARYIEGLKDSIMLKDIIKRHGIKDIGLLENIFDYLVNNASNLISINGIANYFKSKGSRIIYDTVADYVLFLQEAYLIHKCARYNLAGKELLGGQVKIYINDQAFHNYLFPTVRFGTGYLLEGIVYMELLRNGYVVNTGVLRRGEIDFVATKEGRTLFIQVAYALTDADTAEREYGAFRNLNVDGEMLLVTMDDRQFPQRGGVRHIRAWDFPSFLDS